MSDKIELKEKIAFVDMGLKVAWDEMTEDQRKALTKELFILNRYISSVKTNNKDVQEHYLLAVNELYNKGWNTLQKNHPKLLWMLLCMCSYDGSTTFFHEWIGAKKTGGDVNNKRAKILEQLYPNKKFDEIELMASLMTDKDLKELAKDYGWEDTDINKSLKKK